MDLGPLRSLITTDMCCVLGGRCRSSARSLFFTPETRRSVRLTLLGAGFLFFIAIVKRLRRFTRNSEILRTQMQELFTAKDAEDAKKSKQDQTPTPQAFHRRGRRGKRRLTADVRGLTGTEWTRGKGWRCTRRAFRKIRTQAVPSGKYRRTK